MSDGTIGHRESKVDRHTTEFSGNGKLILHGEFQKDWNAIVYLRECIQNSLVWSIWLSPWKFLVWHSDCKNNPLFFTVIFLATRKVFEPTLQVSHRKQLQYSTEPLWARIFSVYVAICFVQGIFKWRRLWLYFFCWVYFLCFSPHFWIPRNQGFFRAFSRAFFGLFSGFFRAFFW